ncbi:MAG: UDP-N-acetylmuramoyl-tripeptide--D-alanyl-D-alanine ligase [Syntrophomonadaceae bacterium]|nr:UDP-N-acetylmuramoyl-tripeptide--D-alanyl-D-alanine ligase [Syntrophomonadaceae bacterium]MDD3022421.1 UDP-N-acetylmuramoyl-tripeptide--D-alanyl-D-alanine ligase [Syntrophomonadaceae bacterium]
MMNMELGFISDCVKGVLLTGDPKTPINGVEIDSRRMAAGKLFFALQGENFDGHSFLDAAFERGAAAAVISSADKLSYPDRQGLILVDDTLQALQDLARAYRNSFAIPVIAVTGSVGKTTSKDILDCCLKQCFNTLKTKGNYNNDIGLPLTIMELQDEHQLAIVELAMRAPGEIARLANIARPNCALISNVAAVHLETMGTVDEIAKAKCEVLAELDSSGFAMLNGDNEELIKAARAYSCKKYSFGYNKHCDFRINEVSTERQGIVIEISFQGKNEVLWFPLPAKRLAGNVVSAAAVAFLLGVGFKEIKAGLAEYVPSGNRLRILPLAGGGIIINDSYNANPLSMAAALETGSELRKNGHYVAVLGDMFELGDYEIAGHREVGRAAAANGVEMLLAIGKRAWYIARAAEDAGMSKEQIHYFATKEQGSDYLRNNIKNCDTVLFKASRGMELESMVDDLLKILNQ